MRNISTYIRDEANFVEMVTELGVMESNHLGEHCQVFWSCRSANKQKDVLEGGKNISQGIWPWGSETEIVLQTLDYKQNTERVTSLKY